MGECESRAVVTVEKGSGTTLAKAVILQKHIAVTNESQSVVAVENEPLAVVANAKERHIENDGRN